MSTLRDRCTQAEHMAHAILDLVRAGLPVSARDIRRALITLGEVV